MKKYLYAIIIILSAAHAHSNATSAEGSLSKREVIEKVSPVAAEALRRLEVRRGVSYKNYELNSVMQNSEYRREYATVHYEFCAKKENATNLTCIAKN
ncbi:hypothetical protein [Janthinobacterium sp. BJB446]|uniref:hypothetical protein n=1 Tax=Janthinobacterium sp. BJB446 TaxID=2048009 RepID=UPI00117BD1DD|nr:hypothetical protein [Janthinobacterium sp. BJB446]